MNIRLMHEGQQFLSRREQGAWCLPQGGASSLRPNVAGKLTVRSGRLWITHDAAPGDWVLDPGMSLQVQAGDLIVVEDWGGATPATFEWAVQAGRIQRARLAWGWRGLADLADAGARALAGLADWARARNAAPSAMRAQGNISSGASMASCGGV